MGGERREWEELAGSGREWERREEGVGEERGGSGRGERREWERREEGVGEERGKEKAVKVTV